MDTEEVVTKARQRIEDTQKKENVRRLAFRLVALAVIVVLYSIFVIIPYWGTYGWQTIIWLAALGLLAAVSAIWHHEHPWSD